jgi:hypothetical protein
MNKKAQQQDGMMAIATIIGIFILLAVGLSLASILSCSSEKSQLSNCQSQLAACQNSLNSMNESVLKCNERINTANSACQGRIDNATQTCEQNLNSCKTLFDTYRPVFVIYNIFIFSLFLTISFPFKLFGININLGKYVDSFIKAHKWLKWLLFVAWILAALFTIALFLSSITAPIV